MIPTPSRLPGAPATAGALAGLCCCLGFTPVWAQSQDTPAELPTVTVTSDDDAGFVARRAQSVTKSDVPLAETPQSVSVVTRDLMDSQQTTTLAEALRNVAGVVSGNFGRRGWDDFIIRGQRASESVYTDGLLVENGQWVAQEPFGAERIEVLKGPGSILFGRVQPGGLVNIVSKRPRPDPFTEFGLTYGSYDFKQATFDIGRPLSESGRGAFRIAGLAMNRDDPTDYVYAKTRYIAPSLSLDLGPDTDFTILASYNDREYVRQQGLPVIGTILPNRNGPIPQNRFIGEPSMRPYQSYQARLGYALEHRFGDGWKLQQNFRYQMLGVDGRAVFMSAMAANQRMQNRSVTLQDIDGTGLALDTNLGKTFTLGGVKHAVMVGLDLNEDSNRTRSTSCRIAALDVFAPVYGAPITCPATPGTNTRTVIRYAGLYARDQIAIADRLHIALGLRQDWAQTHTTNYNRNGLVQKQNDSATTGSAGVLYRLLPGVSPYVSYARSFLPASGTDFAGQPFKPETGQQYEAGVKFEFDGGRAAATLAAFDLRRQNVLTGDPDHDGFSIATGEQHSRGLEAEFSADLRNGWNLHAAYAYTSSEVSKDNSAAIVGRPLNSVPRHSLSVWNSYRFRQGPLSGFGVAFGVRAESARQGYSFNYRVPGYAVADAAISYLGRGYRASLNVRNLFDKVYYPGGLNNNVVPLGDPRQLMFNVTFFM